MAIVFPRKIRFLQLPFIICIVLSGCYQQTNRSEKVIASRQILYDLVQLDSIPMTSPVFYTEGFFRVRENGIYLFDYDHASLQVFDTTGHFLDTILTYNRIQEFRYGGFTPEGSIYLMDKNYQMHFFNSRGVSQAHTIALNWQRSKLNYAENEYNIPGTYSIDMQERPFDTRWLPFDARQQLLIPLWISPNINKRFNRYRWRSGYYRKAAVLGAVQLPSAHVQSIFGKKSPLYEIYNNIPDFDFGTADVRRDTIYVSSAIDSAIYVYAPDHSFLYAFGCSGKNMNLRYPQATEEKAGSIFTAKALAISGYYYHLFCDSTSDLIFRSHTTYEGKGSGLQVYQGNVLVAEAKVPQRFNVIGKIGNWYYADGMVGGYNRLLGVYRFQLARRSS